MNDVRTVVRAVNLALKTVRYADVAKKIAVAVATVVCSYVVYRIFTQN